MPLWTEVMHMFGKNRTRVVMGKQAMDLLKSADDLLDESFKMLAGIQPRLAPSEYEDYQTKHNKLYLMVVAVKSDARDKEEQEGFFATPEEKQMFYSQVQKLFRDCRAYHTDVISVSRQAHNRTRSSNPGNDGIASTQISSTEQATGSDQPWVSVPRVSPMSVVSDNQNNPGSLVEGSNNEPRSVQPFIATLTDIPQGALAAGDELISQFQSDREDGYYRVLICGNKYKRAVIVDPNLRYANQSDQEDGERSQDELLQVGDMMMRTDSQSLTASHEVIDSHQGTSFITSLISTLPFGTSGLTLGGML